MEKGQRYCNTRRTLILVGKSAERSMGIRVVSNEQLAKKQKPQIYYI